MVAPDRLQADATGGCRRERNEQGILEDAGFQELPNITDKYQEIKRLFQNDEFKILKKNGTVIGIITEGDYCEDWIFVLTLVFIFKCTIIVCAMRTKNQKTRLPIALLSSLLKEAHPLIETVRKRKKAKRAPKSVRNQANQEFAKNLHTTLSDVLND